VSADTDLATLLQTMRPELHEGAFEFVSKIRASAAELADAVVVVREDEGVTLVRPTNDANPEAMAWITLTVHSSLLAVGLTAAVATVLAEREIACNVVAGFHHDHLFVPFDRRDEALKALGALGA
jgi:uncharacterized protein